MLSPGQWIGVVASALSLAACERAPEADKAPKTETPADLLPVAEPPLDREG